MTPKDFGIVGNRTLTIAQQGRVRARCILLAMRKPKPEPSLAELRWSDDERYLYVQAESGLLECGLQEGGEPVLAGERARVYDVRTNPAAASLMGAISEVLGEGEYASSEARRFYEGLA